MKEQLIEKYKNLLKIHTAKAFKDGKKKEFSSEKIFLNFIKDVTGSDDLFYKQKNVFKNYELNDISLCDRYVQFEENRNYDTIKEQKTRKVLMMFPVKYIKEKYVETEESKKRFKWVKDHEFEIREYDHSYDARKTVYAISYQDAIFELSKDEYDMLEKMTIESLVEKSLTNIEKL